MANKQKSGILGTNKDERNKVLHKNGGKYSLYNKELNVIVGQSYDVYKRNDTVLEQNPDILRYTHGGQTDFSKDIYNRYGIDAEKMMYYSHTNIKPSYKINNFDGFGDYISYMFDIYGKDETYAGHLMGLMGVRDLAEKLELDATPDFKGKTAQDVINEILQYSSVDYALEADRVGIVKDINVAMALAGRVTTNINNYSGKETKMGLISNTMYGLSLLKGATLNSMRRTNYITPELDTLYGNNLSNVYNLSSLFRIDDETGRIADPVTDEFITELPNGSVFDYLAFINPDFKLPDSGYDWSKHPNYGVENKYFGVSKSNIDKEYVVPEGDDWTLLNSDRQFNKGIVNDSYRVYSEGSKLGESITMFSEQETSDGFYASPIIDLERDDILKKTNEFLNNRKAHTMISRFHDAENQENTLTQSAVYKNFGISHGRNLLTKDSYNNGTPSSNVNGYSNPYCRVWTNHHQYSKMKHLIRPFISGETFTSIGDLQKNWTMFRTEEGAKRLSDYSVLNKNGMVNITPVKDKVDVKNCMFSIENLAWKDVLTDKKGKYRLSVGGKMQEDNDNVLSEEQRGPNGGRIMWFPPYDITFQETSSAKWSENEFIGRGEPVFTYVNSTRSGTLEFSMLVDHPSVIDYWLMNKENTEENEQTLLRYFAGCEPIDPDEDVIERIMSGSYKGGTKDPKETETEKDIVFYTFFPNNFSGVEMDPEEAIDKLFGGMGRNNYGDGYFLGYEMGVNPMSINSIIYDDTARKEEWYLDEVYDLLSAEKKFGDLEEFQQNANISLDDVKTCNIDAKNKFSNVGERNKTNPLYIFFEYDGSDTYSGAMTASTASEAFARYKFTNMKTYYTNSKDPKPPYEFLNEKEEVICSSKYGEDGNSIAYWIAKCTGSTEIPYQKFENKRKFSKSQFIFGCNDNETEYYVKYGGQTYEFKNITDKKTGEIKSGEELAKDFIEKNNIIPEFDNKQQFEESGELYGYTSEPKQYYYYDLVSASTADVLQKMQDVLTNNGVYDDDYIIGKYYENHKFSCIEDFGFGTNYGVIQFFYTGKLQETGEAYETIQDFIARHNIMKNCLEDKKVMNEEVISFEAQGATKYLTKDIKDKKGYVTANINWNLKEPILSYPVDKGKETEILRAMNYYDMVSFGLNSTLEVVKKEMGDESVTFSFGEVYAALKGDKEKDYVLSCERGILKSVLKLEGIELEEKIKEAEERIDYLKNIFNPKDGIKTMTIKEVLTLGAASSHGYTDKNKVLANNRENTIKDFLKTFPIMKDVDMSKIDTDGQLTNSIMEVSKVFNKDINDITAKKGRQAKITIVVGEKDVIPAKVQETTEDITTTESEIKVRKNRRYDNEYLFFKLLEENDNIAYKRLVDKVKYFSPAFHSITPEGFNARLTFLQQCTRQGPTSSASDITSGSTASNLAFGRAPFCVLRLGDFLNTKIVITSVNITYPDSMWDLNPEGIGVQFMMAKVSMQIHILGGSDISAPIKRLQNAVSFNYYANTSIYDNRSDIAEYDKDSKSIIDKRQWFVDLNKK